MMLPGLWHCSLTQLSYWHRLGVMMTAPPHTKCLNVVKMFQLEIVVVTVSDVRSEAGSVIWYDKYRNIGVSRAGVGTMCWKH